MLKDLLHSQDKVSVRCAVLVEGSKCSVQSSEHSSFFVIYFNGVEFL